MTAASFPPGIDPEVWEEVDEADHVKCDALIDGRHFVRREPTPTVPVLPSEVGRCGALAPSIMLGGEAQAASFCRLPHGHGGWHKGDDDSEWNHLPPVGVPPLSDLNGLDPEAVNEIANAVTDVLGWQILDVRYGVASKALTALLDLGYERRTAP